MALATFWQNLRYVVRVLAKNPGFTTVAILSLALGIGANTAIFTLINALLLRELPVRQPERIVQLSLLRHDGKLPFSYPMFREVERNQRVFTGLFGWGNSSGTNVEVRGVLELNRVVTVTGQAYSELGATPVLGRLLTPEDCDPGSATNAQVAVIGYEFWQRRFGGALDVVGTRIRVEGHPFTIVGVTRKWFTGLSTGEPPEVTLPVTAESLLGSLPNLDSRSILWLGVFGRLKDGVSIEQARAQLQSFWPDVLLATVTTQTPGLRRQTFLSMGLEVAPAARGRRSDLRDQFARPLYVLAGIVGLILLVACVNLANLMLARAAARSHEMSVRVAIGASRASLILQVLTESLALSLAGALLGLAFAFWGSRLLLLMMTAGNPLLISLDLSPDVHVLVLTVSVAVVTGLLFGLAPAWRCSRQDPAAALQQNVRGSSRGAGALGKTLVIAQVSLSLILLLGAGLFVRSFERLRSIDTGFQKQNVLEIGLNPVPRGYEKLDLNSYRRELIHRISNLPGVVSVAFSESPIPGSQDWNRDSISTLAEASINAHLMANTIRVSPNFFRTAGIALVQGRDFNDTDDEHHPRLAVVSRSLAKRLFPGGDVVGQTIRFSIMPEYQSIQIVGVADDARILSLRDATLPILYLCAFQEQTQAGNLVVRTTQSPEALAASARREIDSLGHEYALQTRTVSQIITEDLVEERVTALLSGFFAALALLLASIGLYGLMSYAVTRRTREIGVRVAMGAQRENILWMVLRETLTLALLGIAIGIPAALVASRLIATMLFGITPTDLPTMAVVSALLLAVAAFAGYLPARRASTIDPIHALRTE
jgi:predicted permease